MHHRGETSETGSGRRAGAGSRSRRSAGRSPHRTHEDSATRPSRQAALPDPFPTYCDGSAPSASRHGSAPRHRDLTRTRTPVIGHRADDAVARLHSHRHQSHQLPTTRQAMPEATSRPPARLLDTWPDESPGIRSTTEARPRARHARSTSPSRFLTTPATRVPPARPEQSYTRAATHPG